MSKWHTSASSDWERCCLVARTCASSDLGHQGLEMCPRTFVVDIKATIFSRGLAIMAVRALRKWKPRERVPNAAVGTFTIRNWWEIPGIEFPPPSCKNTFSLKCASFIVVSILAVRKSHCVVTNEVQQIPLQVQSVCERHNL